MNHLCLFHIRRAPIVGNQLNNSDLTWLFWSFIGGNHRFPFLLIQIQTLITRNILRSKQNIKVTKYLQNLRAQKKIIYISPPRRHQVMLIYIYLQILLLNNYWSRKWRNMHVLSLNHYSYIWLYLPSLALFHSTWFDRWSENFVNHSQTIQYTYSLLTTSTSV